MIAISTSRSHLIDYPYFYLCFFKLILLKYSNSKIEKIYNKSILEFARLKGLPVIDLVRSFDVDDPTLYQCQIEPSYEGGKIISELIAYVMNNYDFVLG